MGAGLGVRGRWRRGRGAGGVGSGPSLPVDVEARGRGGVARAGAPLRPGKGRAQPPAPGGRHCAELAGGLSGEMDPGRAAAPLPG